MKFNERAIKSMLSSRSWAFAAVVSMACGLDTYGLSGDTGLGGDSTLGSTTLTVNSTAEPTGATEPATTSQDGDGTASSVGETGGGKCGDKFVDGNEQCDDGNMVDGDACTNACTLAFCGDGVLGPGEACDDGNDADDDACNSACVLTSCGDGNLQVGEECDSSGETDACNANCTLSHCGDGVVNASAGETCDDGNELGGDLCGADCRPTELVEVAIGWSHLCVVFASGELRCWGGGNYGALGRGDELALGDEPAELPVDNIDVGGKVLNVSAGTGFTCANLVGGKVRCWGNGNDGRLGYGDVVALGDEAGEMPTPVVSLTGGVQRLASGLDHTCALLMGGTVECWGKGSYLGNASGQADIGDNPGEMPPPPAVGIIQTKQLVAAGGHTCALREDGQVFCWGGGGCGQLGNGKGGLYGSVQGQMPPPPTDVGGPVAELAAGRYHTCARMMNGAVRCWGCGGDGQLGTGSFDNVGDDPGEMPPQDVVLGTKAVQIAAGYRHTCVLTVENHIRCWGSNHDGELGYGHTENVDTLAELPPPDVSVGGTPYRIVAGGSATCAMMTDGGLRCWGGNGYGVLGYGHTMNVGDDEHPGELDPVRF